jgi:hypothetical protein
MLYLTPYNASRSFTALTGALNIPYRTTGHSVSNRVLREGDVLFNWGNSLPLRNLFLRRENTPEILNSLHIINQPDSVAKAIDKRIAWRTFSRDNILTPKYIIGDPNIELGDGIDQRAQLLEELGNPRHVVVRSTVKGSRGTGISIYSYQSFLEGDDLPDTAKAVVEYMPKRREFRSHIFYNPYGATYEFTIREKLRRRGAAVDNMVRNHDNNWIFAANFPISTDLSNRIYDLSIGVVSALGLDFAGIDIIYNERRDSLYVLEANTAPGLVASTLQFYGHCIEERVRHAST